MPKQTIQMQYLKQRKLNFFEVKKHLLVDEVYTANRVEYQNGTFFGLTGDGACARIDLTFVVHSISRN